MIKPLFARVAQSVALSTLCLGACAAVHPTSTMAPAPAEASTDAMSQMLLRFDRDQSDLFAFYDHAPTSELFARKTEFYDQWLAALRHVNYARLTASARTDYHLLLAQVTFAKKQLSHRAQGLQAVASLIDFSRELSHLESQRRLRKAIDIPDAAKRFSSATAQVEAIRKRVAASLTKPATAPAIGPIEALRAARYLRQVQADMQHFTQQLANYEPEATWWLRKPHQDFDQALSKLLEDLTQRVAGIEGKPEDPLIGDPIGEQALNAEIAREQLSYNAQELIEIGEHQLRWCERELLRAAHKLGKNDIASALEYVKSRHVAPGKQSALVNYQAQHAIDFVESNKLVTVPALAKELWRLEMSTAQVQRYLPFASYNYQYMSVAYPTDEMTQDQREMSMRANNIHFSRIVTPHELIPGHHLQFFMANRHRAYRSDFGTPFFIEGWAVYWELLFWDQGYATSPEDDIGMLFWRMHRAMRIIISLRYHLGQMTPQEMVDFLVAHGHEVDSATSEVRRYIEVDSEYGPLYQAGYLVGALQLLALREELGIKSSEQMRSYHDRLLTFGPIAPALIRAELTGKKVAKEGVSSWRFYDTLRPRFSPDFTGE